MDQTVRAGKSFNERAEVAQVFLPFLCKILPISDAMMLSTISMALRKPA
jgi:hypothetical protein